MHGFQLSRHVIPVEDTCMHILGTRPREPARHSFPQKRKYEKRKWQLNHSKYSGVGRANNLRITQFLRHLQQCLVTTRELGGFDDFLNIVAYRLENSTLTADECQKREKSWGKNLQACMRLKWWVYSPAKAWLGATLTTLKSMCTSTAQHNNETAIPALKA